jgi:phosphoglucomutase
MAQNISPLAGHAAPPGVLVDVAKLQDAYFRLRPAAREEPAQRVVFGTSGHRGSSFERSFNEWHILAITQAICEHRNAHRISGPLFIGADTHALSPLALETALEVLAANAVEVMTSAGGEYAPTPAISHAILTYNKGRSAGLADGIVVTPSHNPPDSGGFKYNPPNGGPADTDVTSWIQTRANALLETALDGVRRVANGASADTTHTHDYLNEYVADLGAVIEFSAIREAGVRMGVDPLGGAGVHYWTPIAERYGIDLTVISERVDPQFAFMSLDWDGKIRMDPSSPYAMRRLTQLKDRYDISGACDTDHDRHGIVTRTLGLMPANDYLTVMIDYLFRNRTQWSPAAAVGKTVVSTALIDRVAARLGRKLFETPVGFKWFSAGLLNGSLGFAGEESAGAALLRLDGSVWTTDKDGIVPVLLAAEITARSGKDPSALYRDITADLGEPFAERIEAPATPRQKEALARLTADQLRTTQLAGEEITQVLDRAPANAASLGGIKVVSAHGWFAARPSGTEQLYKIYAESFLSAEHLRRILADAARIVDSAIK